MFALGTHGPDARYGVVVDVGSATVAIAIVASEPGTATPHVVWSHKERLSITAQTHLQTAAKNIATATMNAMMTLGSEGLVALTEYDRTARLSEVLVTVSAPWSYTVTRTVTSSGDDTFVVTSKLVDDLVRTATDRALELIGDNELFTKLGLAVVFEATIDVSVNGYTVQNPIGQTVEKIVISRLTGIVQKQLVEVIEEAHETIIPKAQLSIATYLSYFYLTLKNYNPEHTEVCLVDVTAEATEIGVVREGVLRYVTHAPLGLYHLIREIASITDLPVEEVYAALRTDFADFSRSQPASKQSRIDALLAEFSQSIAELFAQTGDTLSIPKSVYLHTDTGYETFFSPLIAAAATTATGLEHSVHAITSTLSPNAPKGETKMLLTAYVFHNQLAEIVTE